MRPRTHQRSSGKSGFRQASSEHWRWLARLAVICLRPSAASVARVSQDRSVGHRRESGNTKDWDHPSRRGASINDREEGVWMHSGDRCAVAFVAGRGTSEAGLEAGGWKPESGGEAPRTWSRD